jgi:molecular chaperone DnaK (HSP70)
VTVTRPDFVGDNRSILDRIVEIIHRALQKANLEAGEVDHFLLVGGGTRMPCVEEAVADAFGRPVKAIKDREFAVAKGAAIHAVNLGKKSSDRALAAAVLHLPAPEIEIKNKTAHPLSIRVTELKDPSVHTYHVMIPRQSELPREVQEYFRPVSDFQPSVEIVVGQGEEGDPVTPSSILYKIELPLKPCRLAERENSILVKYRMDSDAIIHVHAWDLLGDKEGKSEQVSLDRTKVVTTA